MRGGQVFLLSLSLVMSSLTIVEAAWGKKKKPAAEEVAVTRESTPPSPKPAAEKKKSEEAKAAAGEAQRILLEKKRQELNNTEWQIELISTSGKEKKENDILTFKNNQISSAAFGKKGFLPTNYTLTLEDDGIVILETMQTSEKEGVVFWRGEFDREMQRMRGIQSYRLDDKTVRDYSFFSTSRRDIVEAEKP